MFYPLEHSRSYATPRTHLSRACGGLVGCVTASLALTFLLLPGHANPVRGQGKASTPKPIERKQDDEKPPPQGKLPKGYTLRVLPTARDSQAVALADLLTLDGQDFTYNYRYLWVEDWETRDAQVLSALVNEVMSRAPTIKRPVPILKEVPGVYGKVLLLRLDLRDYSARQADFKELTRLWEDFQLDPAYSFLITAANLERTAKLFPDWKGKATVCRSGGEGWRQVAVPEGFVHTDGYTYYKRWERVSGPALSVEEIQSLASLKDVELVRLPSLRSDPEVYDKLVHLTQSQAPVVSARYFTYRAMNTVKDKGLYSQVYGGRYYELVGIPLSTDPKQTDEEALLEKLGVGNFKGGASPDLVLDQQRSDRRGAMTRSNVTGHIRVWEALRHLRTGLTEGQGLYLRTLDLRRQDIDSDTNQLANLLKPKVAAKETIFENANGTHAIALHDGKGKRQDVVPDDVAHDHTIPSPHNSTLQGLYSCKSCHQAFFADGGWRPLRNDVLTIVRSQVSDIYGDLVEGGRHVSDTVARVAGLYKADERTIERLLDKARLDYAATILLCTGPMKDSKRAQTDIVQIVAKRQVNLWRRYWYDSITASSALRELGVELVSEDAEDVLASEKDSLALLRLVLPPDPRGTIVVDGRAIVPEDPNLAALKAGLEINRPHFDLVKDATAERAWQIIPRLRNLKAGKAGDGEKAKKAS